MSIADGQRALTRTPKFRASRRRLVLSPTTACLVIAYGTSSGAGVRPAIDAVFTMCPERWRTMIG